MTSVGGEFNRGADPIQMREGSVSGVDVAVRGNLKLQVNSHVTTHAELCAYLSQREDCNCKANKAPYDIRYARIVTRADVELKIFRTVPWPRTERPI